MAPLLDGCPIPIIAIIAIIANDTMPYKTINLHPQTYQRLLMYKHAGMTFDDVIQKLMEDVPEDDFYKEALKVHEERMEKMKKEGGIRIDSLKEALDQV